MRVYSADQEHYHRGMDLDLRVSLNQRRFHGPNHRKTTYEPISNSDAANLTLHIRAEPLYYNFSYSVAGKGLVKLVAKIESKWLAFAPTK